jgi:membrane protease YdiL (CAAX protease family)
LTDPTHEPLHPPQHFVLTAVLFEGGLAVVAVALGWLLGVAPAQTIRWDPAVVGWGVAACVPLLAVFWICLNLPIRPLAEITRVIDEMLVPLFRPCRLWELAAICLLAGVGEEMLFRGVIQEAVARWVGGEPGTWVGLLVGSVLFGLVHPITRTYALMAGLIGLYLGWLWIAGGNLLLPITTHAVYDFVAIVYLVRIRGAHTRHDPGE